PTLDQRAEPPAAAAASAHPAAEPVRARAPGVAGSWYPRSPDTLARLVDGMLDDARPPRVPGGPVRALIAPHAGYEYSGPTAASPFRVVRRERRRRVIVIGPAHEGAFHGVAIDDFTHYRTPLGDIPIDRAAIARLRADAHFVEDEKLGAKEHSI